ncbi:hypothetical protein SRABI128_05158 [Microbacterium sp. Bi128]|nr:hypothetical protein SRABI128_05158 [Microbacterium sp. Bi128]
MEGSFRRAQNANAKLTTSIVYVQPNPAHATSTPASNGPAVMVSPKIIMLRAFAAGSNSLRTSTGMMALRAGWLMAWAPLCTATSA